MTSKPYNFFLLSLRKHSFASLEEQGPQQTSNLRSAGHRSKSFELKRVEHGPSSQVDFNLLLCNVTPLVDHFDFANRPRLFFVSYQKRERGIVVQ